VAWYLRTAPAYLARASRHSKEDEVTREKNRSYIETPPFERTTLMTRIIVSVIKSAVFILGIVLASCFIGRGANSRMKHVVGVQQRFIARRDRKINRW
jgi:hypothetical protein